MPHLLALILVASASASDTGDTGDTCAADSSVFLTGNFETSTLPTSWVLGGSAMLTASVMDAEGEGWLRLTDPSGNQTGYALLDEALDACGGLAFSFDYAAYSGSGAYGIGAWLIDGAIDASSFAIGNSNGHLGYVGLASAYLGVGIDEYGDFSSATGLGTAADAITLAGSADDDWAALASTGASGVSAWDSGRSRPSVESDDYRQLFVVLEPGAASGFDVTVYLREGYQSLPEAILSASTEDVAPETLKLGLSATTGSQNNIHEVGSVSFAPLGGRVLADARATISASIATPNPGDPITITFTASDMWSGDIAGLASALVLDPWLESPTWTCADADGAPCATASGSGDIASTDDIASGDARVWTVSATVGRGAYGTLTVNGSTALDAGYLDMSPNDNDDTLEIVLLDYDADGDGLTNQEEGEETGTDPTLSDTDGDSLSDGDEISSFGTDPLDADGDDDGLTDGEECTTYATDPADADMDDDGLTDYEELILAHADPRIVDTDGDGLTDYEEYVETDSDPNKTDTDGDGLSDYDEVVLHGTDPRVSDSDGEGLTDGDEVNSYGTDPTDTDTDDDRLDDRTEIQETGTDPNDADSDDDTLDDREELDDWGTDPGDADSDDDGLDDATEIYDTRTDPLDDDSDGDGLSDGEEVNDTGTDPDDSDTDSDGISDSEELATTGTDPLDDDSDDDDIEDGDELDETGTDPNDADSDDDGCSDGDEADTYGTDPNLADSDGDGVGDCDEIEDGADPLDTSEDTGEAVIPVGIVEKTETGCAGCATGAPGGAWWTLAAVALGLRRRRAAT